MGKFANLTKEEFIALIDKHITAKSVIEAVGLVARGNNFKTFLKYLKRYNLREHFINKRKLFKPNLNGHYIITKEMLLDRLKNDKFIMKSSKLKSLLILHNIKENKCEICSISQWNGKMLGLQLHHKDGNHKNNKLDNLQILCPNCHSLTDSFAGKGKKKLFTKHCQCGNIIHKSSVRCRSCANRARKNLWKAPYPNIEDMVRDVFKMGFCGAAKQYGVTDNAVRKHLKKYLGASYKSIMCSFDLQEGGALPSAPVTL